jgi:hypothetical protein
VVSGGVWAFQGIKTDPLACEMFDWCAFISDAALADDLHSYRVDNGLAATILEPGKRFHVHYTDQQRGNRLDLEFTAVMPPFTFADNNHFEQMMRAYLD